MHFLNVDVHFALGALLHVALQLVDFRTLTPNNNSRTRSVDSDDQLVCCALHVNPADAGRFQFLLQHLAKLNLFIEQVGIIALCKPTRLPDFVVAQPKTVRMCFLPQTVLLLLLFRSLLFCALLKSFASLADGSADSLRCLRFFGGCGYSVRCRAVMFRHFHNNVSGALLITKTAAHRRGTHALPSRAFVHVTASYEQRIHVQRLACVFRFALGIGDRASQRFLDFLRYSLLRETQSVQRRFGALSTNQVNHQPRLLRRDANVPGLCYSFDLRRNLCRCCHHLCLWRRRCPATSCSRPGRCSCRSCRRCRPFERRFHRVPLKGARR